MSPARARAAGVVWLLLLAFFGYRAVTGFIGSRAYMGGARLAAQGSYSQALPLLERAAIGDVRVEALWLRAQVRAGLWRWSEDRDVETLRETLGRATQEYLEALRQSPASAWPWTGLSDVFGRLERLQAASRPYDLRALEQPWFSVGPAGRTAVGLAVKAVEVNPTDHGAWDLLAAIYDDYGLMDEALEAIRGAAAAQPDFRFHDILRRTDVDPRFLRAFNDASRAALGSAPMLQPRMHWLSLGRVEHRLGNYEQAERDLRRALDLPANRLQRAEGEYHLGRALLRQGKLDEAQAAFDRASDRESYRRLAVPELARLAEARGDLDGALALLAEARRVEPRKLSHCLETARVAVQTENWGVAAEALTWAMQIHPDDPRPRLELIEVYVREGRPDSARRLLDETHRRWPEHPRVQALRDALGAR